MGVGVIPQGGALPLVLIQELGPLHWPLRLGLCTFCSSLPPIRRGKSSWGSFFASSSSFPRTCIPSFTLCCSFLPQVCRPKKQALTWTYHASSDASYSPDITAKYHGSAMMRTWSKGLRSVSCWGDTAPPPSGLRVHKSYITSWPSALLIISSIHWP